MDALPSSDLSRNAARATCVAHAWVRRPIYEELQFSAGRRREHTDEHAAKILTAALVLGVADELIEKAEKLLATC